MNEATRRALDSLPAFLAQTIAPEVETSAVVADLMTRPTMSPEVAVMAGMSLDPMTRPAFDAALQTLANVDGPVPLDVDEVVIGGGVHAAVYAAVRVARGYARPLVLDSSRRFGGAFAQAGGPTFFLNSRNRPGTIGAPGRAQALNVLPGAPMQPADIGQGEYQVDADLGMVARCALALNATIRQALVERVERAGNGVAVFNDRTPGPIMARRVIVATGLTVERTPVPGVNPDGSTIIGARDWFKRMAGDAFPLADLGRVAVIGSGDTARTVIESLVGIGPAAGSSVASLDYVDRVDWFGGGTSTTRADYCAATRPRYARIGALLPRRAGEFEGARVRPFARADQVARGYRQATVNGATYDTVITACGYEDDVPNLLPNADYGYAVRDDAGNPLAYGTPERDVVIVGPAAGIPLLGSEPGASIEANRVAMYRLNPRTAALAALLGGAR